MDDLSAWRRARPPGPPTGLVLVAHGRDPATGLTWLRLAWDPATPGSRPVRWYRVRLWVEESWTLLTPHLPAGACIHTLRHLPAPRPGSALPLTIQVQATDSGTATSAWSAALAVTLQGET